MQSRPEAIQEYDQMSKRLSDFVTSASFRLIFGDSVSFAVLPFDLKALQDNPEAMKRILVAITTTSAPVSAETFGSLAALLNKGEVTKEESNGLQLLKVSMGNRPDVFFYAYIDQQDVLLALSPEVIKACVDNKAKGQEQTLASWPAFSRAKDFWAKYPAERTYGRNFVNIERITDLMRQSKNPDIERVARMYQGFDQAFDVTYTTGGTLENRGFLSYREDKLEPQMKALITLSREKNAYLHLLRNQPLCYVWDTSFDLENTVGLLNLKPEDREELDKGLREALGLGLQELSGALGPQYGLTLDAIVNTGLFPLPKITVFVQLRDKAMVEKAVAHLRAKIEEEGGTAAVEDEVDGKKFISWPLLPGDAGQPAVGLTDTTFYLTSSTQGMKEILRSTAVPGKIPENITAQLGEETRGRLASANASSMLVYPGQISEPLLGLIDFANNYISGGAIQTKTLKRELGALLNSMEWIAGAVNVQQDRMEWNSTLKWAEKKPETTK